MKRSAIILLLVIPPAIFGQQHNHGTKPTPAKPVALETGLGNVNHPVSTKNPQAQKFFNQGLAYIYGFNHEEAIKSFKRAAELDPKLAMAYWGTALALGSNYNLAADSPALKEAYANLQKAVSFAPKASPADQAYIKALAGRYAADPDKADLKALAVAYKTAMGELVKKYPNDLDAATLYAESMMNLRPWQLWSIDGKPAEGTMEIVEVLEGVLKRNPNHSGANHYYIHAVEASRNPEKALASAKRLGGIAPGAGHLVHMPSHIYIRTGDYVEAAKSNADAIVADRNYIRKSGSEGVYPMMYYNHNIHFLASASAMNGNYAQAIKSARNLYDNVKPLLSAMPMLEMFTPYPTVTLVRFRKWEVLLREEKPSENMVITTAMWHFARGVAFAETGKADAAGKELAAMREKIKAVPADAPWGNSTAQTVLKVAEDLLAGEEALARGNGSAGREHLKKAVAAEDLINYNEPPDWDLPAREWLGRAYLSSQMFAEAEMVYRDELVKHPKNGRAIFGLIEALRMQKKGPDAERYRTIFKQVWSKADTTLAVSDLYFR
jgi:tetratricopeptide (TPR) repeat protein